jgi:hypothetical protein
MKTKLILSCLLTAARKYSLLSLYYALAISVALPEELPAAPLDNVRSMHPTSALLDSSTTNLFLAHCCHAHPLYPHDSYCCHSGGVVVAPGAYYGPVGVRGTSRRVARRTVRRVSRRRR